MAGTNQGNERKPMKTVYVFLGAVAFGAALHAKPQKPVAAPASKEVVLTATSANVKDSGTPVKIRIFRWSNDDERAPLVTALTAPPPGAGRAGGGRPGGAGRAAGGGAGRAATTPDAGAAPPAAAADQAGGDGAPGEGAAGGGAGGGRAPQPPSRLLPAAREKPRTVGSIGTTDVPGYSKGCRSGWSPYH